MPITIKRRVVMTDEHSGIHRGAGKLSRYSAKLCSRNDSQGALGEIVTQQLSLSRQHRRDRKAAMADHLCGDALAHLTFSLWVDRQGEI
jgi:hypothetical protein